MVENYSLFSSSNISKFEIISGINFFSLINLVYIFYAGISIIGFDLLYVYGKGTLL